MSSSKYSSNLEQISLSLGGYERFVVSDYATINQLMSRGKRRPVGDPKCFPVCKMHRDRKGGVSRQTVPLRQSLRPDQVQPFNLRLAHRSTAHVPSWNLSKSGGSHFNYFVDSEIVTLKGYGCRSSSLIYVDSSRRYQNGERTCNFLELGIPHRFRFFQAHLPARRQSRRLFILF
jgi:hypothetical protein